jgi:hypothetical protein
MSKRLFMIHAWEGNSSNHIRIKGELKKQNEYFDFEYDIIII